MPRLSDADIREGLQIVRRHYVRYYQSRGHSEAKAKELAEIQVRKTSGQRVRAAHHFDAGKERVSNRWRDGVRKEQALAEEAKDNAEIEAARARGRLIIGGT